jgi:hypothetical protein
LEEADEVIGDICRRLIEGDMMSKQKWRPAATLDFLVQGLVTMCADDNEDRARCAKDILGDILLSLTYLEISEPDPEQDMFDKQWDKLVERIIHPPSEDDEEEEEE